MIIENIKMPVYRPPGILPDLAQELFVAFQDSSARRELQRKRWNLLNDNVTDLIEEEINERFESQLSRYHLKKFLDTSNNAYKAIIDKVSTVYKEPARRRFERKADTKLFQQLVDLDDLNLLMEEVNRITMALNECLMLPVVRTGSIEFDVITPDICEVIHDGFEIEAILYEVEGKGYRYIDRNASRLYDENGNPVGPGEMNRLGFVPVVVYRRRRPVKGFWLGYAGEDLVSLYLSQVIYRSWIESIAYFQSHKELAKKPAESSQHYGNAPVELQMGPSVVHDGEFTVLDLRTDVGPHIDAVESKLSRTAANWGISSEVLSQSKLSSGLERLLSHSSLNEVRMATIKVFRPACKQLMRYATQVWNASDWSKLTGNWFSFDPQPHIDYTEPRIIESPKDEVALLQEQMKAGVGSPVDYIMSKDPDIKNRAQAMEVIERNLEEAGKVLEARRRFAEPEQIAQATGAVGGQISGQTRKVPAAIADTKAYTEENNE
jgi:hypothetical protein